MLKTQYIYIAFALLVIVVLVGMLMKVKEGFCNANYCAMAIPGSGVGVRLKRVACATPFNSCPNNINYEGNDYVYYPKQNAYYSASAKRLYKPEGRYDGVNNLTVKSNGGFQWTS